jgi:FSR family fosmidomycin resistance protein-like MFS transporter
VGATIAAPGAPAIDRRAIATLAAGHGCVDFVQSAVAALLPFLIHDRGWSYTAAGALLLVLQGAASLPQPLFGLLADRRSLPWLLPASVAVAGIGIAAVGATGSATATFLAVAVVGLGSGAYHPEGARWASYVSGVRRASGMSLYSVGGTLGCVLGPLLVAPLVLTLGLRGVACLLVPLLLAAGLLARELPHVRSFHPTRRAAAAEGAEALGDRWRPFGRTAGIVSLRTGIYFGLQGFVPVWFVHRFGSSTGFGDGALTAVLVSGVLGTIVGGRVADRIGRRRVVILCSLLLAPLLLAFALSASEPLALALLVAGGFFVTASYPTSVVLGQSFLPARIGVASGMLLGASAGVGGAVAALLGVLADAAGLRAVLLVLAAIPLAELALALGLPREEASSS